MDWVIGDIHGMLRPLEAVIDAVRKRDSAARFIFAGDYVNRGPDSPGVVNLLLRLENAIFLRGNHDEIFDLILNGQCYIGHSEGPDIIPAFQWFMSHGLADTLSAYGANFAELEFLVRHPDVDRLKRALAVVPTSHRQFFRNLQPVSEHKNFFVAHAYWNPDETDGAPDIASRLASDVNLRHHIIWERFTDEQISKKKRWRRTGYFGHTPINNYRKDGQMVPVSGPQIVLLDTGVALSVHGRLTAICPDTGEIIQSNRAGVITA